MSSSITPLVKSKPSSHTRPMPGPSLSCRARFPLTSPIDVVLPDTFHRESFPTVVKSRVSADCACACVAIHASATTRCQRAFAVAWMSFILDSCRRPGPVVGLRWAAQHSYRTRRNRRWCHVDATDPWPRGSSAVVGSPQAPQRAA